MPLVRKLSLLLVVMLFSLVLSPVHARGSISTPQAQDNSGTISNSSIDPHSRVSSKGEILPPADLPPNVIIAKNTTKSIKGKKYNLTLVAPAFTPSSNSTLDRMSSISGDIGPLHIIGNDDRWQSDTRTYPARAVVHITGDQINGCSGYLYDDDTVATAAHCIHTGGRWVTGLRIYPARNLPYEPYRCGALVSYTVQGWITTGLPDYDYGAIKLDCRIGNTVGWFGLKTEIGAQSYVKGYPGDKPWGTQWGDTGTASHWSDPILSITNDIKGGASGSPVYYNFSGCSPCSYGIVTSESNFGPATNFAIGISPEIFNNLVSWK